MATKPKTKSRTGCVTCKTKRLKCDEHKPACHNCTNRNICCGGYAVRFKWCAFDGNDSDSASAGTLTPPNKDIYPASKQPRLLLHDHLELASLAMVGKSTRDIKLDNDLLARGINPDSYRGKNLDSSKKDPPGTTLVFFKKESPEYGPNVFKTEEISGQLKETQMRRSFSNHEGLVPCAAPMQRSYLANTPQEVETFRSHVRRSSGLASLAEAAADERRARGEIGGDGRVSEVSPAKSHLPEKSTEEAGAVAPHDTLVPLHGDRATPREWLGDVLDLNLTPSLSALINYVFTADDPNRDPHKEPRGAAHKGDAPLSPLDLAGDPALLHPPSPSSTHDTVLVVNGSSGAPPPTPGAYSAYSTPSKLLMAVGEKLSACGPVSPSIAPSSSIQSLLRSSEYEQILFLFLTYTCGIMSIKAGVAENPWRNVILPLATRHTYLFNSIAAMTLFHLAGNTRLGENCAGLRAKGYFYMKKCILELATGLTKMDNDVACENHLPADIALATCINLAVSESWDTHTSSGIAHLKGAKSMIQKVLTLLRLHAHAHSKNGEPVSDELKRKLVLVSSDDWRRIEESAPDSHSSIFIPRNLQLLFNAWIYFEVLAQMTSYSCLDDKGIDLVATITTIIHHTQKKHDDGSSASKADLPALENLDLAPSAPFAFLDSFDGMLANTDYVDPLLGCAQSLFVIMGRVSNLISRVGRRSTDPASSHASRNSLANILAASELRKQLLDWQPSLSVQNAGSGPGSGSGSSSARDSTWDTSSCVSTAEAYRYATLLYLHQAVPEIPSLTSHHLAEKIFILLASIPTDTNLHIVHIFPLLVSSCEAEPGEERDWCEARWALLSDRIWIGNIDRALEVVKEVWRRKDDHARRVRREIADSSFGRVEIDHLHGLLPHLAVQSRAESVDDDGIGSKLHWSSVMREWAWEVLLA